jgi:hypothetical protein
MRWTGWVLAVAVLGLAGPAAGYQPGCASCNGGMNVGFLGAEPCAGPPGYCLAPGCCEDHRYCCDNAWAGYCEHRARVDAFWARVGQPNAYGCRRTCVQAPMPCYCSGEPSATPVMQPTPATRPTPALQPIPATPAPAPAAPPERPAPPRQTSTSPYILRQW